MEREDVVLAVLAGTSEGQRLTPVQVQKLFFLLDERGGHLLGHRLFDFAPYDYGPFDSAVYLVLDNLAAQGKVGIDRSGRVRTYGLTELGRRHAAPLQTSLPPPYRAFAASCLDFVSRLSFAQLVSSIYRDFPAMRANSVFQD